MELQFRNSFFRDLNILKSRALKQSLQSLLQKIESAKSINTIQGIKLMRHTTQFEFKIELKVQTKIYWLLCDLYQDRIEFIRIKSETWCKKHLK